MASDVPELLVPDVATWQAWLGAHQAQPTGVWLVLAKKGTSGRTNLRYDDRLEEALCQGWIDGQARRPDESTYVQRFTPRRSRRNPRAAAVFEILTAQRPETWVRRLAQFVEMLGRGETLHPQKRRLPRDGRGIRGGDGSEPTPLLRLSAPC